MKIRNMILLIFFFTSFQTVNTQIIISQPISILEGLNDSTITATTQPQINFSTLRRIFDGNHLTEAVIPSANFVITLNFSAMTGITKSKIFLWHNGTYSLETANTLEDLNSRTGSYRSLAGNRSYSFFVWDSLTFTNYEVQYIRMSVLNPTDTSIYFGEWVLEGKLTLTSLHITPYPPKVLPSTTLQLDAKVLDEHGRIYPYQINEPLVWRVTDTSIAQIDNSGKLKGISLGSTTVSVSTESNSLLGTASVDVVTDFKPPKAKTKVVKVALVIQDPLIPQFNYRRIHQKWAWYDPLNMVNLIKNEFLIASDSVIQFDVVETYNDQNIFTKLDTSYMTLDQIAYYFQNNLTLYGELKNIAEVQGRIKYDYNGMVDYYDFDTKRNKRVIDEVWVYAFPFGGMYESQLMGPGAFWWNSPPLAHSGLEKTLSVMGWNYERGLPEAMESMGHRFESAIRQAFGRWDYNSPKLNNWELYTSFDKVRPSQAHIGNIHYPPNGRSDYDWVNNAYVLTYADNWFRFPYLLDQKRSVNCTEWMCGHIGYMRWWFKHLPHAAGVTDSILNNWWHYAIDYYEAVALAKKSMIVGIEDHSSNIFPDKFKLEQNYPNPFNSSTNIRFHILQRSFVNLKIYDILGREISSLLNDEITPGVHQVTFLPKELSSGIYFYSLRTPNFCDTKKIILLK